MKKVILTHLKPLIFLWITVGSYFIFIFQNIIFLNQKGILFGHEYVWSDWPLHIAIANIFAFKNPVHWFSYHPLYADGKFTYYFLSDAISGILMRLGLPLTTSFIVPSILTVFIFLTASYFLFYLLFKSRKIAVLTIFIFLLSAGPGFINFIADFLKNPGLDQLIYPQIEYSKAIIYDWGSGNVVTGLLVPQRAFLLGLTLGVIVLLGLMLFLEERIKSNNQSRFILFFAGLVAGILPVVHAHTFIAIVVITATVCAFNIRKVKELSFFVIPATVISSLIYFAFIQGGIEIDNFFSFKPGWAANGFLDFFIMWWTLWGLTLPTVAVSLFLLYERKDRAKLAFFLGFVVLFIISNLVQFQPTTWDNSKLFFWSYLGFSALCAYLIIELPKSFRKLKIPVILLFLILTSTGILELIRLVRIEKHTYLETPREDIELATRIRENTEPNDRFLTGMTHNNLVMVWAARPILMGYTGWVLNFGFNYQQTERDIINIYQGGLNTNNLLKKHKIKYVLIGPWEKEHLNPDVLYFTNNFPIVFSNENNLIFGVK